MFGEASIRSTARSCRAAWCFASFSAPYCALPQTRSILANGSPSTVIPPGAHKMEASAECHRLRSKPQTAICGSAPRWGWSALTASASSPGTRPPARICSILGYSRCWPRATAAFGSAPDSASPIGSHGQLINYPEISGRIEALVEDAKGAVWLVRTQIADDMGPICRIDGSGVKCYGEHDGLPDSFR